MAAGALLKGTAMLVLLSSLVPGKLLEAPDSHTCLPLFSLLILEEGKVMSSLDDRPIDADLLGCCMSVCLLASWLIRPPLLSGLRSASPEVSYWLWPVSLAAASAFVLVLVTLLLVGVLTADPVCAVTPALLEICPTAPLCNVLCMLCLLSFECLNDLLKSGSCRLHGGERKVWSEFLPEGGVAGGLGGFLEGNLGGESGM